MLKQRGWDYGNSFVKRSFSCCENDYLNVMSTLLKDPLMKFKLLYHVPVIKAYSYI